MKIMKRFNTVFFAAFLLLAGTLVFAQSNIPSDDRESIINNLESLVELINSQDKESISNLISPEDSELQSAVQEGVIGVTEYQLDYRPLDNNIELRSPDEVKVSAKFAASGINWSINGLSTYFVFERQGDDWFITETNFHERLGSDYIFDIIKKIFLYGGPILLLFTIFWLWMLIDCIRRDFGDKTLWIILLVFLNILGAILYYFFVKRKNK